MSADAQKMPLHAAAQPDHREKLINTARKLGMDAGQASLDLVEQQDPDFGKKAYEFVVAYVRKHRRVAGEAVTLAARLAGIRPKDDRAFGPVYAKAIKEGTIRVVGSTLRTRGHGTSGGRVYGPGKGRVMP
jgi:hypothetical protein